MKKIDQYHTLDVLFFERPLVDLRKFAFKIAKCLKGFDEKIRLGAVCIEFPEMNESTYVDHFYHRDSIADIDKFLIRSGIKIIVFTNYRVPDIEFILHAKKLGIKTIMIQEGVMFDGMNINDVTVSNIISVVGGYFGKALSYINMMRNMCKYDGRSFTNLLVALLKDRKNITHVIARSFSEHLICDYVLTMGRYWDDYYVNQVGYKKEQIRLIGDHDLDDYTVSTNNEHAICYIANVLVEDGTVKKEDFLSFIETFANAVDKKTKIYIKLHPRSDQSLYKSFEDHNVEFMRKTGALPSTTVYVGHRSALLGRALYESDNLIIWRFANEEVCFYERFATAVCTNKDELISALSSIDIGKVTNEKRDEIESVYWKNPQGAIYSAAEIIHNYYNNQKI